MSRLCSAFAVLLVVAIAAESHGAVTLQEFTESTQNTTLRLQGNDFGLGSGQTGTLSIVRFGRFWDVNAQVTETVESGVDVLRFTGALANLHKVGPHADDQQGTPVAFTASFDGNGLSTSNFLPSDISTHPNGHFDVWTVQPSITFTGGDITGWEIVFQGNHAVPEPTTLAVWSVLSLTGIGIGVWRRQR